MSIGHALGNVVAGYRDRNNARCVGGMRDIIELFEQRNLDMTEAIAGYRSLTEDEIAKINTIKHNEKSLLALLQNIHNTPGADARCVALAKTNIEQGFMWLVRAIARPNNE